MTDLIQHKLTAAEKQVKREEKAAKQAADRQAKIDQIPQSVHGCPVVEVSYTAASKKQVKNLRREFTPERSAFLKHLAQTQTEVLKALGISERAITEMGKGNSPNGYNVHHKMPLAGGGKNEFSNFILIKNDPYHTDIHKVSDLQICKMQEGEIKKVKIPMPEGSVFVPPADRQRVQEAVKQPVSAAVLQKIQRAR